MALNPAGRSIDMTRPVPTQRPVRRRPAPLRATVRRRTELSPHLLRITVGGDDLSRFRWPGPAGHLKLMLPLPGAAEVALPEPDEDGTVAFSRESMPLMRTYTARRFDAATGELDIDLVLHGVGPASDWAEHCAIGDPVAVSVPRAAGFVADPEAEWILVAGDASALPAVATITESVTALPVAPVFLVEIDDPADRLELGASVRWLVREAGQPPGAALEAAVADEPRPPGRGQVWVAGEAACIRRIRTGLLAHLAADQITTRGYWRDGTANHPDHDYGEAE
jgi:NADPH-dependent ferric siderophore reductase